MAPSFSVSAGNVRDYLTTALWFTVLRASFKIVSGNDSLRDTAKAVYHGQRLRKFGVQTVGTSSVVNLTQTMSVALYSLGGWRRRGSEEVQHTTITKIMINEYDYYFFLMYCTPPRSVG